MKKNIFFTILFLTTLLLSTSAWSQAPQNNHEKSKETIIRQKGDADSSMTITINGDDITVNGKPLADYHNGNVSILKRDLMEHDSRDFTFAPRNDDEDVEINALNGNMNNIKPEAFLGVLTEKTITNNGVKINSVINASAAQKAGLQKDDIITMINNKKITSPEELLNAVRSYKPGDMIKVTYLRDSMVKYVNVKLGETQNRLQTFLYKNDFPDMGGNNFNLNSPGIKFPKGFDHLFNYRYNDDPKIGLKVQDIENNSGVKILNVKAGSAADKAGLKKDDIITEVNGEKVTSVDEVKSQLSKTGEKESFTLTAKRNNAEMNFEIKNIKQLNSADL